MPVRQPQQFQSRGIVAGVDGTVASELSRIEGEFPGWRPWLSDAGRCWATRRDRWPGIPPEWWAMTVDGDDPDGLRKAIAEQERLANPVGAT
jgi:hypothetical protein